MAVSPTIRMNLVRDDGPVAAVFALVHTSAYPALQAQRAVVLHPRERAYFGSLKHERRQISYLTGRCAAKQAAAVLLEEQELAHIEIGSGVFEQPFVRYPSADRPEITISHCDQFAVAVACAAGHVMGLDIECVAEDRLAAVRSQLTPADDCAAATLPGSDVLRSFCLWTMKEALSKAIRSGFMVPFAILAVEQIQTARVGCYQALFSNFRQYRCDSFVIDTHVVSIVMPKNTRFRDGPLDFYSRAAALVRRGSEQVAANSGGSGTLNA